ncbi:molybdenum cofactor guanylyltransferase [Arenicella chitinivorans]|uniref:Molybdenum cofactor guanylyltransferase n=1 Tax=Arenicella chitinivorans TaxID=1329800 RepID=A0A918RLW6_9GAMM|nr:molybdenum cofactor guanylyltransferase MobA [Arenicella chitinivorans]GHA00206.1 molybdenum cofactor guanylyltransferase [Arenicella chitinivorans]
MQLDTSNLAGLILAGGASRRMQGLDKGLQAYQGRALVAWTAMAMQPCVCDLIISANRNHEQYAQFARRVLHDSESSAYLGPMAGICRSIEGCVPSSTIQGLLVSPCDTPGVTTKLWQSLVSLANANPNSAVVCHNGERLQSLHCLLPRPTWDSLLASYADGNRAMHRWLRKNGAVELDCSDHATEFQNLNYLEELRG